METEGKLYHFSKLAFLYNKTLKDKKCKCKKFTEMLISVQEM